MDSNIENPNTKILVTHLLKGIVPFLTATFGMENLEGEKLQNYLQNSYVGFGINYKLIVDAAQEQNLLVLPNKKQKF